MNGPEAPAARPDQALLELAQAHRALAEANTRMAKAYESLLQLPKEGPQHGNS